MFLWISLQVWASLAGKGESKALASGFAAFRLSARSQCRYLLCSIEQEWSDNHLHVQLSPFPRGEPARRSREVSPCRDSYGFRSQVGQGLAVFLMDFDPSVGKSLSPSCWISSTRWTRTCRCVDGFRLSTGQDPVGFTLGFVPSLDKDLPLRCWISIAKWASPVDLRMDLESQLDKGLPEHSWISIISWAGPVGILLDFDRPLDKGSPQQPWISRAGRASSYRLFLGFRSQFGQGLADEPMDFEFILGKPRRNKSLSGSSRIPVAVWTRTRRSYCGFRWRKWASPGRALLGFRA